MAKCQQLSYTVLTQAIILIGMGISGHYSEMCNATMRAYNSTSACNEMPGLYYISGYMVMFYVCMALWQYHFHSYRPW